MSPRISLTRHTAVGDIANLAAFVAPGQIFINEDLVRPVGRYFALKSLGEVPAKAQALPDAGSTLSARPDRTKPDEIREARRPCLTS